MDAVKPAGRQRIRLDPGAATNRHLPGVITYTWRMAIVIVQGVFTLDPTERDKFVETSVEGMRSSRREEGCLEYVMAADPLDPERAVLSERWESMDDLQRHLDQQRSTAPGGSPRPRPKSVELTLFEVATSRSLL